LFILAKGIKNQGENQCHTLACYLKFINQGTIKPIAMKRLLYILPILSLIVTSCYKEPFADAYINPNPAWVGETVRFTNLSQSAERVEWDLGDGNSTSSFNVDHFYYDPGFYDVTLRAFGKKGDMSVATFEVRVDGSELKVIVEDYEDGTLIEGASVVLFNSLADWDAADYDRAAAEAFTNRFGEATFSGLSYQKYYVDVYYENAGFGWVNWLLGEEDVVWIETQDLIGTMNHTFVAYVDYVEFDKKKKKGTERLMLRPDRSEMSTPKSKGTGKRELKENKISVPKEERK
jgi:hypothetical protein